MTPDNLKTVRDVLLEFAPEQETLAKALQALAAIEANQPTIELIEKLGLEKERYRIALEEILQKKAPFEYGRTNNAKGILILKSIAKAALEKIGGV